jgi:hypothetical protein
MFKLEFFLILKPIVGYFKIGFSFIGFSEFLLDLKEFYVSLKDD